MLLETSLGEQNFEGCTTTEHVSSAKGKLIDNSRIKHFHLIHCNYIVLINVTLSCK